MKRIITYFSIVAALAFAASCTVETPVIPEDGDGVITLQLQASALETRADGDVDFENVVTHADFFFFSDEEGTTLLDGGHVRLNVAANGLVKNGNLYEYKFDATADGNPALKGPSYVYVIANYPEEITATKLDDILALDVKTDLSGTISYFVMDSYNSSTEKYMTYLSPSKAGDSKTYKIGLTRTAAKLVLNFNVIDSYTDEFGNVWTPGTSSMWVNFVNARKNAVVEAAPVEFTAKADYFTTAQVSPTAVTSAKTGYTSWTAEVVYTYPQSFSSSDNKAPYFKLYCPWMCPSKGTSNFYYKIILPKLDTFKRNKIYTLTVDVSVIGGTEDDWALVADYIYVADWFAPKAIEAEFESALYLDVPVYKYEIYGINFVDVPVTSSNDIEIVSVSARQQLVTQTLGTTDENPVGENADHTIRSYTCVPTKNESFRLTYNLDNVIINSAKPSFDCTPIEWTVTIRHKQTTDEPCLPANKTVSVKIIQYPAIYARLISGENSFVNGYYTVQTASVTPKPTNESSSGGYFRYRAGGTGVVFRSGPDEANSYGRLNTDYNRTKTMTLVTVSAFDANSDTYTTLSATATEESDGEPTKTYIIGDPRVSAGYTSESLFNYLWGNQTVAWSDANAGKIKIGSDQQKNLIAPAFLIASEIGGRPGSVDGSLKFEGATKRCATYQEAGYPAGRWRLPTEAELYFLYSLQNMKVIDNLFNGGNGYWASSGNVFGEAQSNDNQTNVSFQFRRDGVNTWSGHNGNHSIRCIYDIWYWGIEPVGELHTYSIMP